MASYVATVHYYLDLSSCYYYATTLAQADSRHPSCNLTTSTPTDSTLTSCLTKEIITELLSNLLKYMDL